MILNYDSHPKNSIAYVAGKILTFSSVNNETSIDDLIKLAENYKINLSIMFLTIDWLFLIGKIKKVDELGRITYEN